MLHGTAFVGNYAETATAAGHHANESQVFEVIGSAMPRATHFRLATLLITKALGFNELSASMLFEESHVADVRNFPDCRRGC